MSADAQTPTDAQPIEGDGAAAPQGSTGNLPWDLDAHPEELRPYLAEELKKVEGGITQKFQEAAEFRRQMEPLAPLADIEGLADVPKEDLQGLIEFYSIAQDPEQFENWWQQVGEEMNFFDGGGEQGENGGGEEEPPAWAQQLQQRLDQLEGGFQEQTAAQTEQQVLQQIDAEMAEVRKANTDLPWDDEKAAVEDRILQLALSYGDDKDAISKGLADYRAIVGAAQGSLVDGAENAPGAPLAGGNGNTAPETVNGFDDAKEIAKRRFAGAR